jgi:hypothetical protein
LIQTHSIFANNNHVCGEDMGHSVLLGRRAREGDYNHISPITDSFLWFALVDYDLKYLANIGIATYIMKMIMQSR